MDSTALALPHGAIGRAAERLGKHRNHLSKVLNGHTTPSPELALAILADEELGRCGLTFGGLLGVRFTEGMPLGDGLVAARPERRHTDTDSAASAA